MSRLHQMPIAAWLPPIMLCALLAGAPVLAQAPAPDPEALEAAVAEARMRTAALQDTLAEQRQAAVALAADVERLTAATAELDRARSEALAAMREQFERIVADPTLDLTAAQTHYRQAGEARQRHQETIAARRQEAEAAAARVAEGERQLAEAEQRVAALQQEFYAARVARLVRELNVTGEISVGNTVTCQSEETIAGCARRGQEEARAQAQRLFVDQVYGSVTEAGLVAQHRAGVRTETRLLDSQISASGFRGQGDYEVQLIAKVSNRAGTAEACALLGLAPADCAGPKSPAVTAAPVEQPPLPAGQYLLTVRSNVRLDEVYIDGVPYGSTKVDVLLPAGEYDVEVRKPGHQTYAQRVRLDRPTTVKAELAAE